MRLPVRVSYPKSKAVLSAKTSWRQSNFMFHVFVVVALRPSPSGLTNVDVSTCPTESYVAVLVRPFARRSCVTKAG